MYLAVHVQSREFSAPADLGTLAKPGSSRGRARSSRPRRQVEKARRRAEARRGRFSPTTPAWGFVVDRSRSWFC